MAEDMGLVHYDKWDNTYNNENDLSQNFQYDIFGSEENENYFYEPNNDDPVYITLETHNGADIRGGYSDTVVCKLTSCGFWTRTAGIHVKDAWNADGAIVKDADSGGSIGDIRTDRWETGYSHNPVSMFLEDVKSILSVSEDKTEVTVELNNGYFATVYAYSEMEY